MREDVDALASCGTPLYWHQCYRGTYDLISPPSFSHPAKMAFPLCYRILNHLKELGLLSENDTILDPMAGIGTTNICAGAMGYKSISIELEDKFMGFQKQNKEYAERRLFKSLDWEQIQGDSRKLSELLKGNGHIALTSPPYEGDSSTHNRDRHTDIERMKRKGMKVNPNSADAKVIEFDYGNAEGQIGSLKDIPLKSIMSPPYEDALPNGLDRKAAEQLVQAMYDKHGRTYSKEDFEYQVELILKRSNREYGDSEGQIGKLKDNPMKAVMSPPYQDSQGHPSLGSVNKDDWGKEGKGIVKRRGLSGEYGVSEGQVGNLKSITSPPYGETGVGDWQTPRAEFQAWVLNELKTKGYVEWQGKKYNEAEWRAMNHGRLDGRTTKGVHKHPTTGYSENSDNIGQLQDKPLKSVVSPPYGQTLDGGGLAQNKPETFRGVLKDFTQSQGDDENNIGNLQDKPLKSVMSPHYEDSKIRDVKKGVGDAWRNEHYAAHDNEAGYGKSAGQIGRRGEYNNGDGESYLEAMLKVYSEVAKVSDVLVVVVKNPTRNKTLRRLDLDTIKILKLSGWNIHCQHRALLFEELEQADLFDGRKKQAKGRLSFFKRLSWQNGQPVANWEDILVCVRK